MNVPQYVLNVIEKLETAGFEAYAVGGCVRDCLLGKIPHDWDLTTSALPNEIENVFKEYKTVDVGSKYGTIIVIVNDHPIEITTFRTESGYFDNRHPSSVSFSKSLEDDLKRRDFTINALAYSPSKGIIDMFNGVSDLNSRIIRCVGDAKVRFEEDALRIMRALRFSATLGFSIDPETITAAFSCRRLLFNISAERIASELRRMIMANDPSHVLRIFKGIIGIIIPELIPAFDFKQNNPYHCYDVWEHTLSAISQSQKELNVRLALLFHDIAKPACAKYDKNGVVHFYGHEAKSAEIAGAVMRRLKFDSKTIKSVCLLISYHDTLVQADRVSVKKMLNKIDVDNLRTLLKVQKADNMAKTEEANVSLNLINQVEEILNSIISKNECFSLDTLRVNGWDLNNTGKISGIKVGAALDFLLNAVIEEKCENTRSALLDLFNKKF